MRWFSTDGELAVFSVGQEAHGIVAVGQGARGVIAIGQLAIGLVVVGQLGVGAVAVGQLVLAPLWGAGMVGIGGRGRFGVLRLLPWPRRRPPSVERLADEAELLEGRAQVARIAVRGSRAALLTERGQPIVTSESLADRRASALRAGSVAVVRREERRVEVAGFRESASPEVSLHLVELFEPTRDWYLPSAFGERSLTPAEGVARALAWLAFTGVVLGVAAMVFLDQGALGAALR